MKRNLTVVVEVLINGDFCHHVVTRDGGIHKCRFLETEQLMTKVGKCLLSDEYLEREYIISGNEPSFRRTCKP